MWGLAVLLGLIGCAGSVIGGALVLSLGARAAVAARWLLPFALGNLLGAATLSLLPEALRRASPDRAMALFLLGVFAFLLLERGVAARSDRGGAAEAGRAFPLARTAAVVVLAGDAVHNFIDGLAIGASLGVGPASGLGTALAVLTHEVPQGLGQFAVLLGAGVPRLRAFAMIAAVTLTALPGVLLASAASADGEAPLGVLLPFTAGGFVYLALADLAPGLDHERRGAGGAALQMALAAAGVATVVAIAR